MNEESPKYEAGGMHGPKEAVVTGEDKRVQGGAPEKPKECGKRSSFSTEQLSKMIIAFDSGSMQDLIRLYDEALNERFEAGIEYAKDTVGEWHKEE